MGAEAVGHRLAGQRSTREGNLQRPRSNQHSCAGALYTLPAFLALTVLQLDLGRDYCFHFAAAEVEAQVPVSCPGTCTGTRQSLDRTLLV